MIIKSFRDLTGEEKLEVKNFIRAFEETTYITDIEEKMTFLSSEAFNKGESVFVFYEDNNVIGTIGSVLAEIEVKGEAFITEFRLLDKYNNYIDEILDFIVKVTVKYKPTTIFIGLKPRMKKYQDNLVSIDFIKAYRLVTMVYNNQTLEPRQHDLVFETLSEDNKYSFMDVCNRAFINSPNGATITIDEVDKLLDDVETDMMCVVKHENVVGMYILKIDDGIGWVDTIAVDPDYQGKGYGKDILKQAISILKEKKLDSIKLIVAESNVNALNIYLNNGFTLEEELSTWYRLDIKGDVL